ncbi:hypothetical protein HNR46_003529 [Haloferula luteola]|uniref:Uncharacterized protein n=1 Tax=Haloferula luteola TaxID=595692 RepID=A0A840VCL6_9BACT|nr:hypothetical protein [Haloferula luteola]MBB5353274.1 hypothetical protein [Haloferula luteola]
MNEPIPPDQPPEIPRGKLWVSLGLPPLLAFVLPWTLAFSRGDSDAILMIPVLVLGSILVLSPLFGRAVRVRYRGGSLAWLIFCYWLGEGILCLSLMFGACVLAFA